MSKKKLLEFGLKEADAFQKNFKIIFDRLVRGYKSMMGKEPEGLDLLKVKMEAREKAIEELTDTREIALMSMPPAQMEALIQQTMQKYLPYGLMRRTAAPVNTEQLAPTY